MFIQSRAIFKCPSDDVPSLPDQAFDPPMHEPDQQAAQHERQHEYPNDDGHALGKGHHRLTTEDEQPEDRDHGCDPGSGDHSDQWRRIPKVCA